MTVGDVLEWVAGAAFFAAAWLAFGLIAALLVAGVCFAYWAQCHSDRPVRRRKSDGGGT